MRRDRKQRPLAGQNSYYILCFYARRGFDIQAKSEILSVGISGEEAARVMFARVVTGCACKT